MTVTVWRINYNFRQEVRCKKEKCRMEEDTTGNKFKQMDLKIPVNLGDAQQGAQHINTKQNYSNPI